MQITVFGASGTIGRHVVTQALESGHQVTAHTRDASRITEQHPATVVEGSPTDPDSCFTAVDGSDAVIVVLGAGAKGGIRAAGTQAVMQAMQRAGVRRLICQSTLGVGSSRDNLNWWWRYAMFGGLLRRAYADHVEQETLVAASDLDWTIVRPAAFTDQPVKGVQHGFDGAERGLQFKVSRGDVAAFLLAQLGEEGAAYHQRAVALSA